MLLFAHLGITLGIVYLLCVILKKKFSQRIAAVTMIGGLLPDIIDKPIGQILFYDVFHNNRIFAHTLLFILILTILGVYMQRRGKNWMLLIAFCSSIHLVFDEMWHRPLTLFWPMHGLRFEVVNLDNYASDTFNSLMHSPQMYMPEITGFIITSMVVFGLFLHRKIKMKDSSMAVDAIAIEKGDHKISLVIPTMNEAKNISHVFSMIPPIVDEIVVIDSSVDDTVRTIRSIRPATKVIHEEANGKGSALKAGFKYASGDIIVMMDADGSMDPAEIPLFVEPLLNGYDVTKGSRILGGSEDLTLFRRFGNFCFVTLLNVLYDTDYTDLCYG
ncbi:MAG: glycosyltransferase, partial [Methanophagales archaeon]|nr:glycosyltransferase [Methanophagales archaeon]